MTGKTGEVVRYVSAYYSLTGMIAFLMDSVKLWCQSEHKNVGGGVLMWWFDEMLLKSLLFKQVFNYLNFGLQVGNGILALLFYDFSIFSMLYFSFYSFLIRFSISGKPPWALPATTSIQPSPAYQPSNMHTSVTSHPDPISSHEIANPCLRSSGLYYQFFIATFCQPSCIHR